ncbi:MAG: RidA family protein [Pseudomonadota bacterium]
MTNPEQKLSELGIELVEPTAPAANYVPFVLSNDLVFVSGQIAMATNGLITGKVGADVDLEAAGNAARVCAINFIGQLKVACGGDLSRVIRIVKIGIFVNSIPDFTDQHLVANGASDLLVDVFGDAGRHARAAVGTPTLPLNSAVEVDGIVQIKV